MKTFVIFMAVALLVGCTVSQINSVVVKGQLFCKTVSTDAPLIVAVADASGAPVSVVGQTADAVAAICAGIGAIPVPDPVSPTSTVQVMP